MGKIKIILFYISAGIFIISSCGGDRVKYEFEDISPAIWYIAKKGFYGSPYIGKGRSRIKIAKNGNIHIRKYSRLVGINQLILHKGNKKIDKYIIAYSPIQNAFVLAKTNYLLKLYPGKVIKDKAIIFAEDDEGSKQLARLGYGNRLWIKGETGKSYYGTNEGMYPWYEIGYIRGNDIIPSGYIWGGDFIPIQVLSEEDINNDKTNEVIISYSYTSPYNKKNTISALSIIFKNKYQYKSKKIFVYRGYNCKRYCSIDPISIEFDDINDNGIKEIKATFIYKNKIATMNANGHLVCFYEYKNKSSYKIFEYFSKITVDEYTISTSIKPDVLENGNKTIMLNISINRKNKSISLKKMAMWDDKIYAYMYDGNMKVEDFIEDLINTFALDIMIE